VKYDVFPATQQSFFGCWLAAIIDVKAGLLEPDLFGPQNECLVTTEEEICSSEMRMNHDEEVENARSEEDDFGPNCLDRCYLEI
jgi:hypothetical protein